MTDVNHFFKITPQSSQLVAVATTWGLYESVYAIEKTYLDSPGLVRVEHQPVVSTRVEGDFKNLSALDKKSQLVKREIVIIRCASCGNEIGEISYIPGVQFIGCPSCRMQTKVEIYRDGQVRTSVSTLGKKLPKPNENDKSS